MSGFLALESGEVFEGELIGAFERAGETVFNTSHSGYEEIASDPSYFKQIVLMTAPMMGNYGVRSEHMESRRYWIEGFLCLSPQISSRDQSWVQALTDKKIPVLHGFDTRILTLRLREKGTPWGAVMAGTPNPAALQRAQELIRTAKQGSADWVYEVSRREVEVHSGQNPQGPHVAVLDYGCKENILRELKQRCRQVTIFNSRTSAKEIFAAQPDGVLLSNGPGDPAAVERAPQEVKELLGKVPVFGICMGHQILSLALGAKTYKLKFGHRGANHPIRDELLGKVYVSSQNHGYAVDAKTLPNDVRVTQVNLNDQTVAGIYSERLRCLGIQYHPESHPGPHDASPLFDTFMSMIRGSRDR